MGEHLGPWQGFTPNENCPIRKSLLFIFPKKKKETNFFFLFYRCIHVFSERKHPVLVFKWLILTMKVNRSGFSIQVVDTHNERKQIRF